MKKLLLLLTCFFTIKCMAQNTWLQKANFGGSARGENPPAFSIGTKGYTGTGYNGSYLKDFWEYDPATNAWTQKADFGGTARTGAVGFSIGSKGYIGTGTDANSSKKDFWEYDPQTNSWTQKSDFGGTARDGATGFSIGLKGYMGTGWDVNGTKKDFWEYDPQTNSWTQKSDFSGTARSSATGFGIGTKGYLGTGSEFVNNVVTYKNDFWEYDPSINSWTQKASFGGTARSNATSFSINTKGYIGTGWNGNGNKDFWEYDPSTNTWGRKADFGGTARDGCFGFSVSGIGYIGAGDDASFKRDFWEYTPPATTTTFYQDNDGDGYGSNVTMQASTQPSGYVTISGDCDDTNDTVYPGAPEICDGRDNDCNGVTDEGIVLIGTGVDNNDTWLQKASLPSSPRFGGYYFTANGKGYAGGGFDNNNNKLTDLWEYDAIANTWLQKANLPFIPSNTTMWSSFSINGKGYIVSAVSSDPFYEYDPSTNTWTQKANLPIGFGRATAVSINAKGYVVPGSSSRSIYRYDPASNLWSSITTIPGTEAGSGKTAFALNGKLYVGMGTDINNDPTYGIKEFYQLDISALTWQRIADFPELGLIGARGFSIAGMGYVVGGTHQNVAEFKTLWQYNPTANSWSRKTDFGGTGRHYGAGFIINDKLYFGTGDADAITSVIAGTNDFWEYTPNLLNNNAYYLDNDGDGFGDNSTKVRACSPPEGYVSNNTDCDDTKLLYADNDGDGYGAGSPVACGVANNTDCNDNNADVHSTITYYRDIDGDGYGDVNSSIIVCSATAPSGYVSNNTDCNDAAAAINPGATEVCNGIDDDCDGLVDEGCPPSISIDDVTVYESQGLAVLTVTLSNISTEEIKINYKTVDGSAVSKGRFKDYTADRGTITIPAGLLSGTISITINNDAISEQTESFDVVLSIGRTVNATLAKATGIVTIMNGTPSNTTARTMGLEGNNDLSIKSPAKLIAKNFQVQVSPNPSSTQFTLRVESDNTKDAMMIRVVDVMGRVIQIRRNILEGQRIDIGNSYKAGVYLVEVIQGNNKKQLKLIKL